MDPAKYHGFIYLVSNTKTGRVYIGKKHYWSVTTLPPLKGYKRKRKKVTEMNWREYTSSSQELNDDIEELGKEHFEFTCILECRTKGEMTYAEANLQHTMDVLTEKMEDGVTNRFYNKQIGSIKFIPQFPVREETREKLRKRAYELPKIECEHCGIICDKPNWHRWHGDNCKKKKGT
jgi:hypothetical protein